MIINRPELTNQLDSALGGVDLSPDETTKIVNLVVAHMNRELFHPLTVTLVDEEY